VVVVQEIIQVNWPSSLKALVAFLGESHRVEFIYQGFIPSLHQPVVQGGFTLGVVGFIPSFWLVFLKLLVGYGLFECPVVILYSPESPGFSYFYGSKFLKS